MKKLSHYPKNNWGDLFRFAFFSSLLLLSAPQFFTTANAADDESSLEEAIEDDTPAKVSKASEAESLEDLERVISEDSEVKNLSVKEMKDEPLSARKNVVKSADEEEEVIEDNSEEQALEDEISDKDEKADRGLAEEESIEEEIEEEPAVVKAPPPVKKPEPPPALPKEVVKAPPPILDSKKKARDAVASNTITNLEFKMEGDKSRVVVSFKDTPLYREERNEGIKQIVYFFDNVETPNRLQRAYDTSEFPSPVNIFTLLQMPGQKPLSKLIIQLRENKIPTVTATPKGLYIDFPAPDKKYEPKVIVGEDEGTAIEENIYASGKKFEGKQIDRIEIKNSEVQDVLRLLAKTSGFNIVIGDDVSGRVGTLSLERLPWDQVFTLVLQSKKLGYVKQGNVIRVGTLASLKAEKEESLANEQSRIKVEPLKTVLMPVSYAKAAEISPRAKNFLTERGTIDVDTRTNTIIVKDIDRTITRVQKLISALDTQPPRVSISARIVEMLTSFSRQIGFNQHSLSPALAGINLSQSIDHGADASAWTTRISASQFANLSSIFTMGESEDKVKILAAPSVSVVANQQATITQSNSFFVPYIEISNGTPVAGVRQFTASLTLDVTPIVAGDGSIFMTLNVKNEIPRGIGSERTVDSRSVATQVLLENGDTAVIGGVFNNSVNTSRLGVPFFSKLPVVGALFSKNTIDDSRNEIMVFLTAKILNAEESFKRNF